MSKEQMLAAMGTAGIALLGAFWRFAVVPGCRLAYDKVTDFLDSIKQSTQSMSNSLDQIHHELAELKTEFYLHKNKVIGLESELGNMQIKLSDLHEALGPLDLASGIPGMDADVTNE